MNDRNIDEVIDLFFWLIGLAVGTYSKIHRNHKEIREQNAEVSFIQKELDVADDLAKSVALRNYPNEFIAHEFIKAYEERRPVDLSIIDLIKDSDVVLRTNMDLDKLYEKYNGQKLTQCNTADALYSIDKDLAQAFTEVTAKERWTIKELEKALFFKEDAEFEVKNRRLENKPFTDLTEDDLKACGYYKFYVTENSLANQYLEAETNQILNGHAAELSALGTGILVMDKLDKYFDVKSMTKQHFQDVQLNEKKESLFLNLHKKDSEKLEKINSLSITKDNIKNQCISFSDIETLGKYGLINEEEVRAKIKNSADKLEIDSNKITNELILINDKLLKTPKPKGTLSVDEATTIVNDFKAAKTMKKEEIRKVQKKYDAYKEEFPNSTDKKYESKLNKLNKELQNIDKELTTAKDNLKQAKTDEKNIAKANELTAQKEDKEELLNQINQYKNDLHNLNKPELSETHYVDIELIATMGIITEVNKIDVKIENVINKEVKSFNKDYDAKETKSPFVRLGEAESIKSKEFQQAKREVLRQLFSDKNKVQSIDEIPSLQQTKHQSKSMTRSLSR